MRHDPLKLDDNCLKYHPIYKISPICSNHFKYERPTDDSPDPVHFLKGYQENSESSKTSQRRPLEKTTSNEIDTGFKRSARSLRHNKARCRENLPTCKSQSEFRLNNRRKRKLNVPKIKPRGRESNW